MKQKDKKQRKYETRICVTCGTEFEVRIDSKTTHCSMKCSHMHLKRKIRKCEYCGKEFNTRGSARFCSNKCSGLAKRKRTTRLCEICGKEVTRCDSQFYEHCFCSVECTGKWYSENYKMGNSARWSGGKIDQNGYWFIKQPDGSYKQEHIIVAEKMLGRPLEENEVVHHINKNKKDNTPENLLVMTRSEHINLHRKELLNARNKGIGTKDGQVQ